MSRSSVVILYFTGASHCDVCLAVPVGVQRSRAKICQMRTSYFTSHFLNSQMVWLPRTHNLIKALASASLFAVLYR